MAVLLSILAILAAAGAAVAAWRAHRASHRLAREMVHLRDRLAEAEAGRAAAEARVADAPVAEAVDGLLRERLVAVEGRLQAALDREASAADGDHDVRDEVRRHLRREGYHRIVFLEEAADGSVLVEAERHGAMRKARARLGPDGRVRLEGASSLRAFP